MTSRAEEWSRSLRLWALPPEIEGSAEESPWIHPPELFTVPDTIEPTPSHERAREVLSPGDSVLDVGCGGGVAAFALTPPATRVVGVDHQAAMLEMFEANAHRRGLSVQTFEGFWPDVAERVPEAEVVTAHHVVYNVGDIEPFLRALDGHATKRVVLELPDRHPLADMADAWLHFWRLERPTGPTSADLVDVLHEIGIDAEMEQWNGALRAPLSIDDAAHFMRIRLCLPASREPEVRAFLESHPPRTTRPLTTIWWDAKRAK